MKIRERLQCYEQATRCTFLSEKLHHEGCSLSLYSSSAVKCVMTGAVLNSYTTKTICVYCVTCSHLRFSLLHPLFQYAHLSV